MTEPAVRLSKHTLTLADLACSLVRLLVACMGGLRLSDLIFFFQVSAILNHKHEFSIFDGIRPSGP